MTIQTFIRRALVSLLTIQVVGYVIYARIASTHFAAAYDLALAAICSLLMIAVIIALKEK